MNIYENNCKKEILNKIQLQKDYNHYSLGKTLYAASAKGNRKKQEDSVLILNHPQKEEFCMIAVSDGVGGFLGGDIASNHVVYRLIYWFESLDKDLYTNMQKVEESLEYMLDTVFDDLKIKYDIETTLSAAIIGENETLIANIGDSRIYTVQNNILKQETRDDSEVQELLEDEVIVDKELMRFSHGSNELNRALSNIYKDEINYKVINNTYDKIIATSDGVTDCLSHKELENIINQAKQDEIANDIINSALTNNSNINDIIKSLPKHKKKLVEEIEERIKEDYYQTIEGGKDNACVAVYVRK